MEDDRVIEFLMAVAGVVIRLHRESRVNSPTNANRGPNWEKGWSEAFDEGFARWMGWRGPEEQEREIRNVREQL
jgi:hypothetical protein